MVPEKKESENVRDGQKQTATLNPLEIEIIDFFLQMSRVLGHPCKIYNILSVAAPVLYIGPRPSHLSEMLDRLNGWHLCASAAHGEVEKILQSVQQVRQQSSRTQRRVPPPLQLSCSKDAVLPKLLAELESGG